MFQHSIYLVPKQSSGPVIINLVHWQEPFKQKTNTINSSVLRATLASYLGHFKHANSHRLIQTVWQAHPWLSWLFTLTAKHQLIPLWQPQEVTSLYSQWSFFVKRFPGCFVLLQVGNCIELYNGQAQKLTAAFDLSLSPVRPPFQATFSLTLKKLASLERRLCTLRHNYLVVTEVGYLKGGMKRRALRRLVIYAGS